MPSRQNGVGVQVGEVFGHLRDGCTLENPSVSVRAYLRAFGVACIALTAVIVGEVVAGEGAVLACRFVARSADPGCPWPARAE